MTLALVLAAWSLFGSGPHAEQHYSFAVAAAGRVRVETSNGSIDVTTGRPGSAVTVTVTKRADTLEEVRSLDVAADRRGNDVTLRGIYPKGCGGSCGGEISFAVVAPPGTALDLTTSNGHVNAGGISADARLRSSNGSVRATFATLARTQNVSLTTSNGQISLALPASAKVGRLRMETSVGRVSSDWPVRIDRSNFVGGSVDQTLNAGGASITLTTSNGSVTLKKI
jgi:DUF4097 and DUF4098 domain-containing protein YvlB